MLGEESFAGAFTNGKIVDTRPQLTGIDLVHLNKKSTLLKDLNSFLKRRNLPTFSQNKIKLIKKHAFEVEFSPELNPKVGRVAIEGELVKHKSKKEKVDVNYRLALGTDRQANFGIGYKDKYENDSLGLNLKATFGMEPKYSFRFKKPEVQISLKYKFGFSE